MPVGNAVRFAIGKRKIKLMWVMNNFIDDDIEFTVE